MKILLNSRFIRINRFLPAQIPGSDLTWKLFLKIIENYNALLKLKFIT